MARNLLAERTEASSRETAVRATRSLALALALGSPASQIAAGPESALPANPVAVTVTNLPLGLVRVNAQERWLSFPASINQRTGVVEYVVVTTTGKTHESVLRTEVEPHHIHVGMLLLGAQPPCTPVFPADLATPPPGDPVQIQVLWSTPDGPVQRPLEDLVVTTNQWQMLPRGPWTYNGSYLSRGVFVAQSEGSIVALQIDPSALINNPRPGRGNDDLHFVNPAVLPPAGTPIEVRLRLATPTASPDASTRTAAPTLAPAVVTPSPAP